MDMLTKYLIEGCAIVVPVLYILGMMIKATPKVPDWLIPYVLGGIGIALCIPLVLATGGTLVTGIIQGVITCRRGRVR